MSLFVSASNRNEYHEYFLGVKAAGAEGWQPYHLHVPIVLKSRSLNLAETSGPVRAGIGIALLLLVSFLLISEICKHFLSWMFNCFSADDAKLPNDSVISSLWCTVYNYVLYVKYTWWALILSESTLFDLRHTSPWLWFVSYFIVGVCNVLCVQDNITSMQQFCVNYCTPWLGESASVIFAKYVTAIWILNIGASQIRWTATSTFSESIYIDLSLYVCINSLLPIVSCFSMCTANCLAWWLGRKCM